MERDDAILGALAQRHKDVRGFLRAFLSFLHRRTDFYIVDPDPKRKIGFGAGDAEAIVSPRGFFGCAPKPNRPDPTSSTKKIS